MALSLPIPAPRPGRRYLRAPAPLIFPTGADVPEGMEHKEKLTALWQSVELELGDRALITSDSFLYWDPTDPKKCLAPDLAVRMGDPPETLSIWKTWEKGAPHVGVEIVSDWDRSEMRVEQKLERYRQAGILEVVRFEAENAKVPVRLWDLFDGDLVERDLSDPEAYRCDALGLYWRIHDDPKLGPSLRLGRSIDGEILPTPWDAERAAKEGERAAKEGERAAKEGALAALEARDAERTAKTAALAVAEAERAAKEAERAAKEAERAAKEAERAAKEEERAAKEAALAELSELRAQLAQREKPR